MNYQDQDPQPNPMTASQREAIPRICELLGINDAPLLLIDRLALCDRFHSVPYASRTTEKVLEAQIELALTVLQATNRTEATKTIANSRMLQDKLDEVYVVTEQLLSGAAY